MRNTHFWRAKGRDPTSGSRAVPCICMVQWKSPWLLTMGFSTWSSRRMRLLKKWVVVQFGETPGYRYNTLRFTSFPTTSTLCCALVHVQAKTIVNNRAVVLVLCYISYNCPTTVSSRSKEWLLSCSLNELWVNRLTVVSICLPECSDVVLEYKLTGFGLDDKNHVLGLWPWPRGSWPWLHARKLCSGMCDVYAFRRFLKIVVSALQFCATSLLGF